MSVRIAFSGGFDPVHPGHISMFESARYNIFINLPKLYSICQIVILNSDDWLLRKKGKYFMPFDDRKYILSRLEMIDEVIPVNDSDDTVCEALERIKPDYFVNGS